MKDQAKIEQVIEDFDFNKVHKVMEFLDWRWYSSPSPAVPGVENLIKTAYRLLASLAQDDLSLAETGGFRATRSEDGEYELLFFLEGSKWEDPEKEIMFGEVANWCP